MAELEGETAIVTGASRGFGRAIAREPLDPGAHVAGVARSESALGGLSQEYGDKFNAEVADSADPSLPERLFARTMPQVVMLNAGAMPTVAPLYGQTRETFSANWHTDVRQAFKLRLGESLDAARTGFRGGLDLERSGVGWPAAQRRLRRCQSQGQIHQRLRWSRGQGQIVRSALRGHPANSLRRRTSVRQGRAHMSNAPASPSRTSWPSSERS